MPCFEAEVDRLSPYSKQITKSMGVEHVFNRYKQIIVYFNDRSMRIVITGFLRGGLRSGHSLCIRKICRRIASWKQAIKNK